MTDDDDRTRVVSPNSIPRGGVVTTPDNDEDPTAVMGSAERAHVLEAIALAKKAPLDFDLFGGGEEEPAQSHPSLDFDLTGGADTAEAAADAALDLDLSTGESSIPVIAAVAASAAITPPAAKPSAAKAPPLAVQAPAASGGLGKWIAIALVIAAAVLATVFLRK